MRTRHGIRVLLLLATGAVVGCTADGADEAAVQMTGDLRFEPATVEIPVGGSVTWANTGVTQHTATSVGEDRAPTGTFDSGTIVGTGTFTHVFDDAGTYTYMCTVHGSEMVGVVTVVDQ